jgi:hypothetical protein
MTPSKEITQELIALLTAFGIPVLIKNDDAGGITLESKDKIDVHNAYKDIIRQQIETKSLIIDEFKNNESKSGLETLMTNDSILKLTREIIDLQVELADKDYYEKNYQGHLKYGTEQSELMTARAEKELPDLIKKAQDRLITDKNFLSKDNLIIMGKLANYPNPPTDSDKRKLYIGLLTYLQ